MKRGNFIAVEGIDGSGSTTQAKYLCEYLKSLGHQTQLTAEPTKGPLGEVIRTFLRKKEKKSKLFPHTLALSFAADRLYHYEHEILPHISNGCDVVSDRYMLSSLVYQGLDLPQAWIKEINCYAVPPDLTVIIDVPESIAKERRMKRGGVEEIFDEGELQVRLRERYLRLAPSAKAIIVDGSGDVQTVATRMIEALRHALHLSGTK